ncbi:hypothetical protein MKZ38_003785 [Zalerion maritima]|uniref:Uncharacterized protein n=1 Tax=Zalerion maritima TaxID=339359 RepID=A0AAD5RME6_9PEZI|nr:hypothetical protein MKZ38_003785 [Zalerion maritima]
MAFFRRASNTFSTAVNSGQELVENLWRRESTGPVGQTERGDQFGNDVENTQSHRQQSETNSNTAQHDQVHNELPLLTIRTLNGKSSGSEKQREGATAGRRNRRRSSIMGGNYSPTSNFDVDEWLKESLAEESDDDGDRNNDDSESHDALASDSRGYTSNSDHPGPESGQVAWRELLFDSESFEGTASSTEDRDSADGVAVGGEDWESPDELHNSIQSDSLGPIANPAGSVRVEDDNPWRDLGEFLIGSDDGEDAPGSSDKEYLTDISSERNGSDIAVGMADTSWSDGTGYLIVTPTSSRAIGSEDKTRLSDGMYARPQSSDHSEQDETQVDVWGSNRKGHLSEAEQGDIDSPASSPIPAPEVSSHEDSEGDGADDAWITRQGNTDPPRPEYSLLESRCQLWLSDSEDSGNSRSALLTPTSSVDGSSAPAMPPRPLVRGSFRESDSNSGGWRSRPTPEDSSEEACNPGPTLEIVVRMGNAIRSSLLDEEVTDSGSEEEALTPTSDMSPESGFMPGCYRIEAHHYSWSILPLSLAKMVPEHGRFVYLCARGPFVADGSRSWTFDFRTGAEYPCLCYPFIVTSTESVPWQAQSCLSWYWRRSSVPLLLGSQADPQASAMTPVPEMDASDIVFIFRDAWKDWRGLPGRRMIPHLYNFVGHGAFGSDMTWGTEYLGEFMMKLKPSDNSGRLRSKKGLKVLRSTVATIAVYFIVCAIIAKPKCQWKRHQQPDQRPHEGQNDSSRRTRRRKAQNCSK